MARLANLTAFMLGCLCAFGTAPASADHLRDFISDLYGGGGIFLPAAPGIPAPIADAHVPHFTGEEQIAQLSALSNGVLAGTGVFAVNSTVTGVTFDLSQGVPVTVEDSLGPLLAERATTLGKGRLNFAFGYSQQNFDELDGRSLSNLQVTLSHQDCCAVGPPPIPPPDGQLTGFEQDLITLDIDIDLEQEVYGFFANYGMTDRWDVGVVVPVVSVKASAVSVASIQLSGPSSNFGGSPVHSFANDPSLAISRTGGKETGIGDVILRTKYNFMRDREDFMDLSVLGQVTFATGDEKELLGTGETKYRAMLIGSKSLGRITPHLNLAYEVSSGDADLENFTYAVGVDARVTQRLTLAADILGRNNPHLESIGNNIIDLALAVKFNPFNDRNMPLNAFVSFPLNDDGLRADVVWGIGFEFTLN